MRDVMLQVGHEVAHAVARHSSEKLSLGIFLTVASQLAIQAFQIYARRNQQGGGRGPNLGGPAQGTPVAWSGLTSSATVITCMWTCAQWHCHDPFASSAKVVAAVALFLQPCICPCA